jgi:hypothetical protein
VIDCVCAYLASGMLYVYEVSLHVLHNTVTAEFNVVLRSTGNAVPALNMHHVMNSSGEVEI